MASSCSPHPQTCTSVVAVLLRPAGPPRGGAAGALGDAPPAGILIGEAAVGCDLLRAKQKGKLYKHDHFATEEAWSLAHLGAQLPLSIASTSTCAVPVGHTHAVLLDITSPSARAQVLSNGRLTAARNSTEKVREALLLASSAKRAIHPLEPV